MIPSLEKLRLDHPYWSWRAVRQGISWRYEGHRDDRRVTIIRCVVVVGPSGDDFETRWMIHETGESYVSWALKEGEGSALSRLTEGRFNK